MLMVYICAALFFLQLSNVTVTSKRKRKSNETYTVQQTPPTDQPHNNVDNRKISTTDYPPDTSEIIESTADIIETQPVTNQGMPFQSRPQRQRFTEKTQKPSWTLEKILIHKELMLDHTVTLPLLINTGHKSPN